MKTQALAPAFRCGAALALLSAPWLGMSGCREAPRQEQPLPEPVRDPTWRDPAQQGAGLSAAPTTTLPEEGAPVQLAPAAAFAEPPEPVTQLMASVTAHALDAFGLVADLPQPVTAVAAGMGNTETWVYTRPVRGSAYPLQLRVSRQPLANLAQLKVAAREIGELPLLGAGTSAGRWWVQKAVEGPVQEWWVALPGLPAPPPPGQKHTKSKQMPDIAEPTGAALALVAVCVGPPAYEAVLRRACLTLHREGEATPPPWDAKLPIDP